MGRYYLIVVEVYYFEPIVDGALRRLIFFAKHKPHEVLIVHFILRFTFEFAWHLIKYTIHGFSGKRMTLISGKVFLVYQEIMIIIEFPKPAIEHVKMFVREILPHHIDIVLAAHLKECV